MRLKLLNSVAICTLFISGCSQDTISTTHKPTIYGEWLSNGAKEISSSVVAKVLYKEKFLKNGDLYSTKWFNFKDIQGRDLGEFYITKLFKWRKTPSKISTKFVRCQTGITKPLKTNNLAYLKLKKMCEISLQKNGRVTTKIYKLTGDKLLLGDRVYSKIR